MKKPMKSPPVALLKGTNNNRSSTFTLNRETVSSLMVLNSSGLHILS